MKLLVGMIIAALGMYRGVKGKLRFASRTDIAGFINWKKAAPWFYEPLTFCLYKTSCVRLNGRLKVSAEVYFNTSKVYVPKSVACSLYEYFVDGHLGLRYTDRLDGFHLTLERTIPCCYMRDNGDGTGTVLDEHTFLTFCKRHGVPMRTVETCMKGLKNDFYKELVEKGDLPAEVLK